MSTLSIIVPVYNVEAYLSRCIESICSQAFVNYELLVTDDGSTDGCAEELDRRAASDSRVLVVHQVNHGVSAARNRGLTIAQGVYVGFVDPDDWVEADWFRLAIDHLEQDGADVAVCGWKCCYEDGTLSTNKLRLPEELDAKAFVLELFARPRTIYGSVCNKVFRRSLINFGFDECASFCEDGLFLCKFACCMRKACIVPDALYVVYLAQNSATRAEAGRIAMGLPVRRKMIDELLPMGAKVWRAAQADYLDSCVMCLNIAGADLRYCQLARDELVGYISAHLFEVAKNKEIRLAERVLYIVTAIKLW